MDADAEGLRRAGDAARRRRRPRAEAAEGTIRKKYATSLAENAVHGSDSDENANIEANFHFSSEERF